MAERIYPHGQANSNRSEERTGHQWPQIPEPTVRQGDLDRFVTTLVRWGIPAAFISGIVIRIAQGG